MDNKGKKDVGKQKKWEEKVFKVAFWNVLGKDGVLGKN